MMCKNEEHRQGLERERERERERDTHTHTYTPPESRSEDPLLPQEGNLSYSVRQGGLIPSPF